MMLGMGGIIVLNSPSNDESLYSLQFKYDENANISEYETLLDGLEIVKNINVKSLKVMGGSDQVVSQVKNYFLVETTR